jgi:enamine deaminase RidA (YjgF/YER057c/UK114 family)
MAIQRINPEALYHVTSVHHLTRNDNTVYISGMAALDKNRNLVGKDDPEAQAEQVIQNVKDALASVGGDLSHIIKWSIYLTRREDIPIWRTVRSRHLSGDQVPAGSLLLIQGMVDPDFLVYLDAVAILP